jgi:hypothetical protein
MTQENRCYWAGRRLPVPILTKGKFGAFSHILSHYN